MCCVRKKLLQVLPVGKGDPPAVGLAPDVNDAHHVIILEQFDELHRGMVAVTDGIEVHNVCS